MSDEKRRHHEGETILEPRYQVAQPPFYKVILLNDDYTSMDFVVEILQKFFQKSLEDATQIMLQIHFRGSSVCGFYPFEIAETKVHQVLEHARKHEYPLQCSLEKA